MIRNNTQIIVITLTSTIIIMLGYIIAESYKTDIGVIFLAIIGIFVLVGFGLSHIILMDKTVKWLKII